MNKRNAQCMFTIEEEQQIIQDYINKEGGTTVLSQKYSRLRIGNNQIVKDLEKHGVVEHKTFVISNIPNIPFKDDFIRGVIEGDGSLRKSYPHLTISGGKDFLLNIADYFKIPYHLYNDKSIFGLHYNKRESEYLEKRLYFNATRYLQRKYDLAKRSFNSPITLEDVMIKS